MRVRSTYPGKLVLPGGIEVLECSEIDVSDDVAGSAGVAGWLDCGWLVPVAKAAKK